VQDAQQLAHDRAGHVRIGPQRSEGNSSHDRKEDIRAQPDNEREIKQSAKKDLHSERIQGRDEKQKNSAELDRIGDNDCLVTEDEPGQSNG
jgi:hypothetical protein